MSSMMMLVPVVFIAIGITVMVVLNMRGKKSAGVAQKVMKEYVAAQLPAMKDAQLHCINLLEDAINAQHIWVLAYNDDGIFFIPSTPNPFTQSIKLYEDLTPIFNIKKILAANLFTGNKSEHIDYVPASAVSNVSIDQNKKKIKIHVGEIVKSLKYQDKDCFGAEQQEEISRFINYLESLR